MFVVKTVGPTTLVAVLIVLQLGLRRAGAAYAGQAELVAKLQGIFLFLALPSVGTTAFSTVNCIEFDVGGANNPRDIERRLVSDLEIDCDTTKHAQYTAIGWIVIVCWPLGVPVYMVPPSPFPLACPRRRRGDTVCHPLSLLRLCCVWRQMIMYWHNRKGLRAISRAEQVLQAKAALAKLDGLSVSELGDAMSHFHELRSSTTREDVKMPHRAWSLRSGARTPGRPSGLASD